MSKIHLQNKLGDTKLGVDFVPNFIVNA